MITKEQFVKGIISYADHEVIPHLPTLGKWGLGTIICLATTKINEIADSLIDNPLIKSIGVVNDIGQIDSDKLIDALKISAEKYGQLDIQIPMLGKLVFSSNDVEKLKNYMCNTSLSTYNA